LYYILFGTNYLDLIGVNICIPCSGVETSHIANRQAWYAVYILQYTFNDTEVYTNVHVH
jgi:hypothetical protein